MDIKNAQEVAFNQLDGKKIMRDIFVNEREKERALENCRPAQRYDNSRGAGTAFKNF